MLGEAARPTPTPECVNNLRFIRDVSIPDGSRFAPGEKLDKRWQVENSGTCNWDGRYRLKLISGTAMEAAPEVALHPARAGTELEVRIQFIAPSQPGTYRSAWQAFSPLGEAFGDPFFIEIVVLPPTPNP